MSDDEDFRLRYCLCCDEYFTVDEVLAPEVGQQPPEDAA